MVTFSDEFAGSNIASKFIKMPKTGFRIVISQETECLNPFEVYVVTLLRRKPRKLKSFKISSKLVQFEIFQHRVICFDQIDTTGAKIKLNDS